MSYLRYLVCGIVGHDLINEGENRSVRIREMMEKMHPNEEYYTFSLCVKCHTLYLNKLRYDKKDIPEVKEHIDTYYKNYRIDRVKLI